MASVAHGNDKRERIVIVRVLPLRSYCYPVADSVKQVTAGTAGFVDGSAVAVATEAAKVSS